MESAANLGQERQLVAFSLNGEEFGVEITQVKEIIKHRNVTRLPHVETYIEGVTNLRGEVIPIICLRKRFGIPAQEVTQDTRIIIAEVDQSRIGFIVDAVTEVMRIAETNIEPPPSTVAGLKAHYLKGVGKIDDRLLILLDVDRILTSEEKIRLDRLEKAVASTED